MDDMNDIFKLIRADIERSRTYESPKEEKVEEENFFQTKSSNRLDLDSFIIGDEEKKFMSSVQGKKKKSVEINDIEFLDTEIGSDFDSKDYMADIEQIDYVKLDKMPKDKQLRLLKKEYLVLLDRIKEISSDFSKVDKSFKEQNVEYHNMKKNVSQMQEFIRIVGSMIPDGSSLKHKLESPTWTIEDIEDEMISRLNFAITRAKNAELYLEQETADLTNQIQGLKNKIIKLENRNLEMEQQIGELEQQLENAVFPEEEAEEEYEDNYNDEYQDDNYDQEYEEEYEEEKEVYDDDEFLEPSNDFDEVYKNEYGDIFDDDEEELPPPAPVNRNQQRKPQSDNRNSSLSPAQDRNNRQNEQPSQKRNNQPSNKQNERQTQNNQRNQNNSQPSNANRNQNERNDNRSSQQNERTQKNDRNNQRNERNQQNERNNQRNDRSQQNERNNQRNDKNNQRSQQNETINERNNKNQQNERNNQRNERNQQNERPSQVDRNNQKRNSNTPSERPTPSDKGNQTNKPSRPQQTQKPNEQRKVPTRKIEPVEEEVNINLLEPDDSFDASKVGDVDPYIESLSDEAKYIIKIIGAVGVSRNNELKNVLTENEDAKPLFFHGTKFQKNPMNDAVNDLINAQILSAEQVKLGNQGGMFKMYELSDLGKGIYFTMTNEIPVKSEVARLIKQHASAEHGFLIKDSAEIFKEMGYTIYTNRKDLSFRIGGGKMKVFDLVIEKDGVKSMIEVERGTHNEEDFFYAMDKIREVTNEFWFICPSEDVLFNKTKRHFFLWIQKHLGGMENARGIKANFTTFGKLKQGKKPIWDDIEL